MPQHDSQNIEKLIWNESFRNWVMHPTPESDAFWYIWQVSNPDRVADLRLARTVVASLQVRDRALSDPDLHQFVTRTLNRAEIEKPVELALPVARPLRWQPLGWAALILLVAGLGWQVWQHQLSAQKPLTYQALTQNAPVSLVERVNETRRLLKLQLPDHSTVWLHPRARISFPDPFTVDKREVYLTGEATFAVVRNPNRPFFVYADEIVTQVLGTRFSVRSVSDEKVVQVVVQTGKVSVFARQPAHQKTAPPDHGVLLTPNQQVIFSRKEERFRKSLVKKPQAIQAIPEGRYFRYDETPIAEVFGQLELVYGISIEFDPAVLKPCTVTATLEEGGLFEKLSAVCRAIGASYAVLDGQILVSSAGCG
ncbi:FecR family protein [Larkinella ripae]